MRFLECSQAHISSFLYTNLAAIQTHIHVGDDRNEVVLSEHCRTNSFIDLLIFLILTNYGDH